MTGDTTPIPFLAIAAAVVIVSTVIFIAHQIRVDAVVRRIQKGRR